MRNSIGVAEFSHHAVRILINNMIVRTPTYIAVFAYYAITTGISV